MVAIWIGIDARERGWSKGWAYGWGMATLFMCLPFAIVYAFMRDRVPKPVPAAAPVVSACRYCGKEIIANPAFCPHCSAQLKSAEEIHRKS
jgi:hypothetical protein